MGQENHCRSIGLSLYREDFRRVQARDKGGDFDRELRFRSAIGRERDDPGLYLYGERDPDGRDLYVLRGASDADGRLSIRKPSEKGSASSSP
jgi:hypothetical protein